MGVAEFIRFLNMYDGYIRDNCRHGRQTVTGKGAGHGFQAGVGLMEIAAQGGTGRHKGDSHGAGF